MMYCFVEYSKCCNGVISILEIGHAFPLIVVDINELDTSVAVKGWSKGLVTVIVDGESQSSKEVTNHIH